MKTVFTNREIPHKWAHATQPHARGSNLSFQGDTLYSYSTPIAKIYPKRDGVPLVLMSERTYSVTTARHLGYAYGAVSHLPVVTVPRYILGESHRGHYRGNGDARKDHTDNLEFLNVALVNCGKKAMRRTKENRVQWDAENAERAHKQLAAYMVYFKIRRKMPPMPGFAAAFERARKIENPDPASLDKRERAAAQRAQAKYATRRLAEIARELRGRDYSDMAYRSDWRLNGAFGAAAGYYHHGATGPCMLRVQGDEIETSLGARIPLAAAPMVWNLVQRAIGQGGFEPSHALGRLKIGDYPLDRIDADGTLHAGCHAIPYSELEVMARQLELAS
jgi:hypothetical protein